MIKNDIEIEQSQHELLSHNNDWLEITEHLFIDIHFEEQIKTIKHGLQRPLKVSFYIYIKTHPHNLLFLFKYLISYLTD